MDSRMYCGQNCDCPFVTPFHNNSGPLHLKTASVFFSLQLSVILAGPSCLGALYHRHTWNGKKFLRKFWTCIKIVHTYTMPSVQKVYWIHKPHNKFCCCTSWIQNLSSLFTSCLVLSSVNIKCTYVTTYCITYLKQLQVERSWFVGIVNLEPHSPFSKDNRPHHIKGNIQVYKLIEMLFHTFGWRPSPCIMHHGLDYHRDSQYYCQICAGPLEYSGRYFLKTFCQRMVSL